MRRQSVRARMKLKVRRPPAGDAEVSAFLGGITEDQNQESGPSTLPVSDKPVTLSFSKGGLTTNKPTIIKPIGMYACLPSNPRLNVTSSGHGETACIRPCSWCR